MLFEVQPGPQPVPEFEPGCTFLDADGDLCIVIATDNWDGSRRGKGKAVLVIEQNKTRPWVRYVSTESDFKAEFGTGCTVLRPGTKVTLEV